MRERHDEAGEDRQREDAVGTAMSRNATNGTQTIFRIATTTPMLSAPSQFSQPSTNSRFCSRVSRLAPGRKRRQCFLQDLESAIGPAVALLLVGLERVRQQAMAVAAVGVMREPAVLEHGQAEIGVLADGVARPAAGRLHCRAADQAHRAVHDDGVGLVPLHHADIEEAGIFAVHGVMHDAAFAVAVILRRLHQADASDRRTAAPGPSASPDARHSRRR